MLMVVFAFSTSSADSSIVILYWLWDFVFLGKSDSSMVSFIFKVRDDLAASISDFEVTQDQLLDLLLHQIQRWFLDVKLCRCVVDLRSQRSSLTTMYVFDKVFVSCCRVVVVCGAFRLPTAFPLRHRCTVDIDQDPPTCLDADGGIKAKRQTFGWCCLQVKCLGRGRREVLSWTLFQMLNLTKSYRLNLITSIAFAKTSTFLTPFQKPPLQDLNHWAVTAISYPSPFSSSLERDRPIPSLFKVFCLRHSICKIFLRVLVHLDTDFFT